ncbi:hypothetical protein LTS18_011900 [Coniosporium uncinatum]|uniref:Uncharacterized protein n=1 Tax=Coniosporium uncinatum TaxID=93489 RepID=A0ACC3DCY0_9PEZI|nr:hypothetical protein LTS18_011900 [Coniosporium uncinatum]
MARVSEDDAFALPSYEAAMLPDPWPLVLPYVSKQDLLSLSTVNSKLCGRVQGHLFAEPRKWWDDGNDGFIRFLKCLHVEPSKWNLRARAANFVQTLDLSGIKDGSLHESVPKDWLHTVLNKCNNLRALLVSETSFFDHDSIQLSLRLPGHGCLRMLSAVKCPNVTSKSLNALFSRTQELYYLDLSGNANLDRHSLMRSAASYLRSLRISKLRGVGLCDQHYISQLNRHLYSLDVRDNLLTDGFVANLRKHAHQQDVNDLPPPYSSGDEQQVVAGKHILRKHRDWSNHFQPRIIARSSEVTFVDGLSRVLSHLNPAHFELLVSQHPQPGLRNLYISGNSIPAHGIRSVLKIPTLQCLDFGDFDGAASGPHWPDKQKQAAQPIKAALKILHALSDAPNLQSLRVGHQIVTGFAAYWDSIPTKSTVGSNMINGHAASEATDSYLQLWQDSTEPKLGGYTGPPGTQWDISASNHANYRFDAALLSLEKLTLTSVPAQSQQGYLTACLKALLQACADMQRVNEEYNRSRLTRGDRPPAYDSGMVSEDFVHIQELRLEIADPQGRADGVSTLDGADFEMSMQDDFSFFPDEKPKVAPKTVAPKQAGMVTEKSEDVRKELAAFRKSNLRVLSQHGNAERAASEAVWTGELVISYGST